MAILKDIDGVVGSLSTTTIVGFALAILLAVGAVKRFILYLRQRTFAASHGCKPAKAFPAKDPFFGIDEIRTKIRKAKEHKLLEHITGTFDRVGANTYTGKAMGLNFISTIEPENVKAILSLRFKEFGIGNREKTLGRLLGRGIFTSDGEPWQHSRAMIRPNFARDQVADLDAFERHMQTLLSLLPKDGTTVDLQELFFRFTIDSATEFLFGQSTGSLKANAIKDSAASTEKDFAQAFNRAQSAVANRSRIGLLRAFYQDKEGDEAIKVCHAFVDQFVDEAVRYREKVEAGDVKDEKYVFLHQLAKETTNKRTMRDELLNVLLAGRDTTASLLSNMWLMLAKHPEVFAKLRAEVEDTLHGRIPTYQELRNMKYLKYCMNESLRLHPVVPANSRLARQDTFLPLGGGPDGKSPLFVPSGTIVSYFTYAMHRRADYYGDDAEVFRPERWELLRPGWEYLPFNGGPRICLGQQYALTEAGYVTVRLIQAFKGVESRDPEEWAESLTLTVCSKNGTLVGLTPA